MNQWSNLVNFFQYSVTAPKEFAHFGVSVVTISECTVLGVTDVRHRLEELCII